MNRKNLLAGRVAAAALTAFLLIGTASGTEAPAVASAEAPTTQSVEAVADPGAETPAETGVDTSADPNADPNATAPIEQRMEVPIEQTCQNINGVQTLIQVFEVGPEVDPAVLQKPSIELDGYIYTPAFITKETFNTEEKKNVDWEETRSVSSSNYQNAVQQFPQTIDYIDAEGYTGTLQLVASSVKVSSTGSSTKTGKDSVTRTFTFPYNDDSQVPSTVTEGGKTYNRVSLSWTEGGSGAEGAIPDSYTATATYSRTYSYSVNKGYRATATYSGEVSLTNTDMIRYRVEYHGTPIEPEEPVDPENPDGSGDPGQEQPGNEVIQPGTVPSSVTGNVLMWGLIGVLVIALLVSAVLLLRKPRPAPMYDPRDMDDDDYDT